MKEKLALTEVRKFKNRMSFGPDVCFIRKYYKIYILKGSKRIQRNRAFVWYDRHRNRKSEITTEKSENQSLYRYNTCFFIIFHVK